MLTQSHELPIKPNPVAWLVKDKMGITHGQGCGLGFSISVQPDPTR